MKNLENRFINIDQADIDSVVQSMGEGALSGTAPVVTRYEEALIQYFGTKHALAVSSGTGALHLLLMLYDVTDGDEVLLPPTAPIMSVLPVLAVGATPVFVDVQETNFGIDIIDLESKLTTKTKAVISVPMWGYPAAEDQIINTLRSRKIPLIEDASHCHGATLNNSYIGTRGDVSFFSTQERKLVSTGEGGFILTDSDYIADRVREIRDFGKPFRKSDRFRALQGQYGHIFGLNYRLSAMSAALGITQLDKLNRKLERRTSNAGVVRDCLKSIDWINELPVYPGAVPNYYAMVLQVRGTNNIDAKHLGDALLQEKIISDTHRFNIKPLYDYPLLEPFRSVCNNAEQLLRNVVTVPTHEGLESTDLLRITKSLKKIAAG